jgi:hypothetical protein
LRLQIATELVTASGHVFPRPSKCPHGTWSPHGPGEPSPGGSLCSPETTAVDWDALRAQDRRSKVRSACGRRKLMDPDTGQWICPACRKLMRTEYV